MANQYGHRIYLHNLVNGEVISYCVVGHDNMTDACSELKLQLKLGIDDYKKYSFQCIGYGCGHNYDTYIQATWEYYYEEDFDALP